MSGTGQPTLEVPRCEDLRLGIVATRWHERITTALLDGPAQPLPRRGSRIRRWCGCRVRSSFPWCAKNWPAGTMPSWRSGW